MLSACVPTCFRSDRMPTKHPSHPTPQGATTKSPLYKNCIVTNRFALNFCAGWGLFACPFPCLCLGTQKMTLIPKSIVVTKAFAVKFCAEWSGREFHSSHGDYFRDHFRVCVSGPLSGSLRMLADNLQAIFRATFGQLSNSLWSAFSQRACLQVCLDAVEIYY